MTTKLSDEVIAAAETAGVPNRKIGRTGGAVLTLADGDSISISTLREAHENWFPEYMATGKS